MQNPKRGRPSAGYLFYVFSCYSFMYSSLGECISVLWFNRSWVLTCIDFSKASRRPGLRKLRGGELVEHVFSWLFNRLSNPGYTKGILIHPPLMEVQGNDDQAMVGRYCDAPQQKCINDNKCIGKYQFNTLSRMLLPNLAKFKWSMTCSRDGASPASMN